MLIAERYTDDLKDLIYGEGYDIRVHALQTSLLILDSKYYENVDINDINFGYFCSVTENIITEFQIDNKLNFNGKIDVDTWNSIFRQLKVLKGCTIIQTGPRSIDVIGTNELLEGSNINGSDNSNGVNVTDSDIDESDSTISTNIVSDNISYEENSSGKSYLGTMNNYTTNGNDTSYFYYQYNRLNGGKSFDDLVYNYIVSGGKVYNNASYSYNINGSESWDYKYITPIMFNSNGSSNKDYDYIYNLLSNSIYEGNINLSPMEISSSNSNVGTFKNPFASSTNKPYFTPYKETGFKSDALKNTKFDITIVYGPKGSKARKIIGVTPMAVSQEINASGEPIYDIYEFIAKDVVDGM